MGPLDPKLSTMIIALSSDNNKSEIINSNNNNNNSNVIDVNNNNNTNGDKKLQDTNARYVGYTRSLARLARYLAFTSDVGEAFRPVVDSRIVSFAYFVSFSYCFADVGYEAYKLDKRGYKNEHNETITMTQCVVERTAFQLIASMAIPTLIIHSTVDITAKILKKFNRFQKWGPTIAGLCVVPLLPLYIDHPVEHALEWGFKNYGPWASKTASTKSHED